MLSRLIQISVVVASLLAWIESVSAQNVVINEFMVLNDSAVSDQFGDFPAWIELYNRGDEAVQLHSYYLSNSPFKPKRWRLPFYQLQPGAYLLIFATGTNISTTVPYHTNFAFQNGEQRLFLFGQDGLLIDATPEKCIPVNRSIARLPDGSEEWTFPSHFSAGETNNTAYADDPDFPLTSVSASHTSGYYQDAIDLNLVAQGDFEIRYTLNTGASPQANSILFNGPLSLAERGGDANLYSSIPSTNQSVTYKQPEGLVRKAHVVRAAAFADGCPVSEIYTGNFLVDPNQNGQMYPADVVFVNTSPGNLFDDTKGIYVYGDDANYIKRGDLWERPANIEFLNSEGASYFQQDAGIRIHGGGTREGPQKSLRLYARNIYGHNSFDYPFFKDRELASYKRLILRMTMGDWTGTLFKDHLCHDLVRDLDVSYMSGKVSVVFVNGEYWGVYNLRERQDKHYLESHFGVDDDNVDMVEYSLFHERPLVEEGNIDGYDELIFYLENNDLSDPANYAEVQQMIDISNFIDQHIAQLYFANTDFPGNNNTLWQSRSSSGIWRWLFYDCDACMARPQYNHLPENIDGVQQFSQQPDWSMIIFRALMRNAEFTELFVSRFRTLLNTTFSAGNVLSKVDEFEELYAPLVAEHIHRWHFPNDFNEWLNNIQGIRQFAIERPVLLSKELEQYFGQPIKVVPNPNVGDFTVSFVGEASVGVVELYDSYGHLMESVSYGETTMSSIQFQRDLPTGVYLIKAEVNGRYYTEKMVVID